VYRNLEVLEELGLVRHVHLGHGPGLYGPAASVEIEYVACHGCGAFRALTGAELEPAREAIRRATGYEAHFGHFPAVGRCPACQDVALDDASHLQ